MKRKETRKETAPRCQRRAVRKSDHTEKNTRSRWEVQPGVFLISADAPLEEMIQAGHAVIDALNARFGGGNG